MKNLENIKINEPNKNDKRPIAKFYRSYLQDLEHGVSLAKCRGINLEQYRAADRLASNYQRAFMNGGWDLSEVSIKRQYFHKTQVEVQAQTLHEHSKIWGKLGKNSRAIIEHFCLNELPMRKYELGQVPQWVKGAGTARLREALDELIEVYRQVGKAN